MKPGKDAPKFAIGSKNTNNDPVKKIMKKAEPAEEKKGNSQKS